MPLRASVYIWNIASAEGMSLGGEILRVASSTWIGCMQSTRCKASEHCCASRCDMNWSWRKGNGPFQDRVISIMIERPAILRRRSAVERVSARAQASLTPSAEKTVIASVTVISPGVR